MDDLISTLLAVQPATLDEYNLDKQLKGIFTLLTKDTPRSKLPSADKLDILDPSVHTLSYLLILNAHVNISHSNGHMPPSQLPPRLLPDGDLMGYIMTILAQFDPIQVRYAGGAFLNIVDVFVGSAYQSGDARRAINPLQHVILRLDPSSSTLTSIHYKLIEICLSSRSYDSAIHILEHPIMAIPSEADKATTSRAAKYLCSPHESSATYLTVSTGLNVKWKYRDFLEYFLMGGMCYQALRQYSKALFFYEVILTTPTVGQAVSMVMVEAYKKLVLVGLILKGQHPSVPKAASVNAMRSIRALAKPYECLAEAFKNQNIAEFLAEIRAGEQLWKDDFNYYAVLEVYDAYRKFQVQRLGKVFAALPMAEVARRTSPDPTDIDETTAYVHSLISVGDLNAIATTAPDQTTTLRFLPTSAKARPEAQIQQGFESQMRELHRLFIQISNIDHRFETSKEYVDMLKKLKKAKDQENKEGGATGKPITIDDLDENMMED